MQSCYRPLVTGKKPFANVPPDTVFGFGEGPVFEGASPDLSHVVLHSKVQLTETTATEGGLYEWSAGKLQLLSLLPPNMEDKELPASGKTILGLPFSESSHDARHAVSDNGSRVFWTNGEGGHLYMRDTTTEKTTQLDIGLSAAPEFQIANKEGSKVFFTDGGDLYEYNLERPIGERLTDLTPSGAVLSLIPGASEDGSWVYFIANGVLAPEAVPGTCKDGSLQKPGETCNLYVHHDSTTRLVAVLSGEDFPDWGESLSLLTTRVSPDGEWLAFMSRRSLTGYDNSDAVSSEPDEEVYLYNGQTERLVCASCDPPGARPHGVEFGPGGGANMPLAAGGTVWEVTSWLAANVPAWSPYAECCALYQSRYLSDSGRLFFNAHDGLVPKDVNGTGDVYEYEPEGVPDSAPEAARCGPVAASGSDVFEPEHSIKVEGREVQGGAGCVALISSGSSAQESAFLDASETGGDVFFLTTAKLAPQDFDDALDVYDAQECTTQAPCLRPQASQPPECATEASCKAAPSPQPQIFGLSGSATFSGAGNVVAPSAPLNVKPKTLTKAQLLAKALKACRKRHNPHKRLACEKQAHKRYPSKSSKGRK